MAVVSITESVKLTGKSRQTIYRHIRTGKLSKTDNGIDTAELIRVYGEFVTPDTENTPKSSNVTHHADIAAEIKKQDKVQEMELQHLKEQVELLKSQLTKTETQLERAQHKEDKLLQIIENRLEAPETNSVVNILKKKFL